ncbi:hypothetical protein MSAN_02264000 [Mycena sanguinolenta]|uniref:CxC1-like cysteine cluster associated with KDZ transposases domain-containing protein n=1 Tax=Mycena sanguinolenta TaxID=230812 RepID=A0A8H6XAW3_9AGAR|nr:hypothetical protein MSAN_02264000 [Mycena sanguinolenta]
MSGIVPPPVVILKSKIPVRCTAVRRRCQKMTESEAYWGPGTNWYGDEAWGQPAWGQSAWGQSLTSGQTPAWDQSAGHPPDSTDVAVPAQPTTPQIPITWADLERRARNPDVTEIRAAWERFFRARQEPRAPRSPPGPRPQPGSMAYGKPTKSEKNKAKRKERPTVVDGPQNAHYLKKHKPREEPVAYLPHRRTLIEKSGPPLVQEFPPITSFAEDSYIAHNVAAASSDFDFEDDEAFSTYSSPQKGRESPTKKRHQANRENQNETWQREVIPALVPVFVKLWHRTRGLRDADALRPPRQIGLCLWLDHALQDICTISDVEIDVCNCTPAAEQLLDAGLFPSAPRRPTFAADIRVLEFARNLFGRIAPNNTAWTATLESFLRDLGFSLDNEGSMRRMFASSLEWYTHLRNQVKCHFDNIIEDTRRSYLGQDTEDRDATPTPTPTPGTPAPQPVDEDSSRDSSSSPPPASRSAGKKRARETTPPVENPFGDPPPRTRPSEYLRQRCPACFGALVRDGSVKMDIHCCMDACFNQKRDSDSGTTDPPKFHPELHFIPESISAQMEEYVDSVRNTKPSKKRRKAADATEGDQDEDDHYEHEKLKLPRSVLDACEASFKAADENRQKASSQFYDDTGLMALLCRHDRVLWLVNMHSAGEKQFNVWLLLETLMQHLPLDVLVGVLYDIACQAERSARKWGFMARFIERLRFAVSVFHAFGHDWPCQVIYHPLKCEGFGFSNGEGCERFWHSISHLIAHLRISGYHHRIYTLDSQVKQVDEANLFKLAEWNHRRTLFSQNKREEAERDLKKCGLSSEYLKDQWKAQVKAQTKPVPRRSKTQSAKAVATVIALWNAVEIEKAEVDSCKQALEEADEEDENAVEDAKQALEDARATWKKTRDRLRRREEALGLDEKTEVKKQMKTKYFQLRYDARAKKIRLRNLLRARKFEWDRVERTSRRHRASDQKLRAHTEAAVKRRQPKISNLVREYNKLCDAMGHEIRTRKAPRGAIAPDRIDPKKVYALDVDDSIWQDVGLEDDDDRAEPPVADGRQGTGVASGRSFSWIAPMRRMPCWRRNAGPCRTSKIGISFTFVGSGWYGCAPPGGRSFMTSLGTHLGDHRDKSSMTRRPRRERLEEGEDKYFEDEDCEVVDAMENADVYRGTYDSSGSDED